ncbi:OsmC family protein [Gracilibacillus caseinilyticus]|uniref:OsmC family protein n=1 Tax=Gracilibacillus caseinilyticus TaxID=2932256 RepID=A0ABY4EWS7_9BACI|nr:OsmC family protein [Gracilibacillus caseinilyticus]UOQ48864.1 OsmC family protein [Gracilibacillus caseinilyticus]
MEFYLTEGGVRTQLPFGELDVSGNEELGFRPFQLMIASIAGCSASVFRKVLQKKRIEIEDLHITADVERSSEEANKITSIHLHFVVKGRNLKHDLLDKSLQISRKNCSMVRTIEDSVDVKETLEVVNLSI